jgi:hypothetical protein
VQRREPVSERVSTTSRQNFVPAIHALLVMLSKNDVRMTRSMISTCCRRPGYYITSVARQTYAEDFGRTKYPFLCKRNQRLAEGFPSIIAVLRRCRDDLLAA